MNKKLQELYSSKGENLNLAMEEIIKDEKLEQKPTCPLLIYFDNEENFNNSDIRIMVYGQETNSWYNEFHNSQKEILNNYNDFYNGGECWSYGGQFWNGVSRFLGTLRNKYPDKKVDLIWNNIVKIGKYEDKGFPPDYIYEVEREYFSVIKDELRIIKPNVVLFLTGPNYDSVIEDNFGKIAYTKLHNGFSERQISKLSIPGIPFAFRTYHPNYLWRNDIDSYFESIIDSINFYDSSNIDLQSSDELQAKLDALKTEKEHLIKTNQYEYVARLREKEKQLEEALDFKLN